MKPVVKLITVLCLLIRGYAFAQGGASSCAQLEANYQQYQSCATNIPFSNSTGGNNETFNTTCIGLPFQGPTWFFIKIKDSGPITLQISQTSLSGAGTDVDFVLWGPFNNLTNICSQLDIPKEVDCSWSGNSVENVSIPNAISGQLYVLLIDNYSNVPGNIQIAQIAGTGSSDCDFLSSVDIVDTSNQEITQLNYCKPQTKDLMAKVDTSDFPGNPANLRFNFTWYKDGILLTSTSNSTSSTNTITVSDTGVYKVISTAYDITTNPSGSTVGLRESSDEITLKFHNMPAVSISNTGTQCLNTTPTLNSTITNSAQLNNTVDILTYQWFLNNTAITGATSVNYTPTLPGDYFVKVYNNPCLEAVSNTIHLITNPNVTIAADATICEGDSFTITSTNANSVLNFSLTYQWYKDGNPIPGANGNTFTVSAANQTVNSSSTYYLQTSEQTLCTNQSNSVAVRINALPVINTTPLLLEQCDYIAPTLDGIAEINLMQAYNYLTSNTSGLTLYFYQDAALTNLIPDPVHYINASSPFLQNIYVKIIDENVSPNCASLGVGIINLEVNPTSVTTYPDMAPVCPELNMTYGFADFNAQRLLIKNTYFPSTNVDIAFYSTPSDASTELNPLTNTSQLPIGTTIVYTRIETNNNCDGIGTFNIIVKTPPVQTVVSAVNLCESDTFLLNTKDAEALSGQNPTVQTSYFTTFDDAKNSISPINPNAALPITVGTRTIFIRLYDTFTQCVSIVNFDIRVYPNPLITQPSPIKLCGTNSATFDLTSRIPQITGNNSVLQVTFYQSNADLLAGNAIPTPNAFTSGTTTIFVKGVDPSNNNCYSTTTLNLFLLDLPGATNNPTPIELCNNSGNTGFETFNLRVREMEMAGNTPPSDIDFKYYINENDAIANNSNNIVNPGLFTNTIADYQRIYVRLNSRVNIDSETSSSCFRILELELFVRPYPENKLDTDPYIICIDKDYNVTSPAIIDTYLSENDYTFIWYNGYNALSGNEIIGQTSSQCTISTEGMYSVKVTNISNAANCSSVFNFTTKNSFVPFSVTANPSELIAFGIDNTVTAIAFPPSGDYLYSVNDTGWQTSNVFTNLYEAEYILKVKNKYGCGETSTTFSVVDFPNYFTPNGDGFHDTWSIRGSSVLNAIRILIFDRYGKLLKELNPSGPGWDGTYNGKALPSDDYWFKLIYTKDNVTKEFRGHFAMKR
ncbi:MAG TPA: T9SS type B sorting domain-containing protein [Flavobacterium sp.]|uniref:T9SS type B sorting domain-containing protein n=1 Tax=Flavobacterium sp. TaxID=239 RepID=UPI002BBCB714|nr:T9SS type B sorting domain-containing protein [Flavobacterium sp.]HSD15188.1 T9SS type B sorting domain-containing protein [Flavobacterium sp.]